MDKNTLNEAVEACKAETKEIMQMMYDSLNHGQQKQMLKNDDIKEKFDLYGVEY